MVPNVSIASPDASDAPDRGAAPAQQLDQAQVLVVAAVAHVDEAGVDVVAAEQLPQQVAGPGVDGERLALAVVGQLAVVAVADLVGQPDPAGVGDPHAEAHVEQGQEESQRRPGHLAHRRGDGRPADAHGRGQGEVPRPPADGGLVHRGRHRVGDRPPDLVRPEHEPAHVRPGGGGPVVGDVDRGADEELRQVGRLRVGQLVEGGVRPLLGGELAVGAASPGAGRTTPTAGACRAVGSTTTPGRRSSTRPPAGRPAPPPTRSPTCGGSSRRRCWPPPG